MQLWQILPFRKAIGVLSGVVVACVLGANFLFAFPGARVGQQGGGSATVHMVSGALTTLAGTDNLNVDIPITGQIKAFFLRKNAAASDLMFRTDAMAGDATVQMNTPGAWITNCIQSLGVGTVQLGSNPECNASGGTFYYLALTDLNGDLDTDTYTGTGSSHAEALNEAWTPGLVIVAVNGSNAKVWATTSSLGVSSQTCQFNDNPCVTNFITAFGAGTFSVGTNGTTNGSGSTYAYLAINAATTIITLDHDTRTGNTNDNQTIPFGSTATPVFVVNAEDSAVEHFIRFGAQSGDSNFEGLAAASANCIQGFSAGSWSLGNATNCNDVATYFWWGVGQ